MEETVLINKKSPKNFHCVNCDYLTINKKDFNRHLLTKKHTNNTTPTETPKTPQYICTICNKKHNDRSGLWRHKKKCSQPTLTNEMILDLINQTRDLRNIVIEERRIFLEQINEIKGSHNIE